MVHVDLNVHEVREGMNARVFNILLQSAVFFTIGSHNRIRCHIVRTITSPYQEKDFRGQYVVPSARWSSLVLLHHLLRFPVLRLTAVTQHSGCPVQASTTNVSVHETNTCTCTANASLYVAASRAVSATTVSIQHEINTCT